jgi:hypothetical protein
MKSFQRPQGSDRQERKSDDQPAAALYKERKYIC